MPGEMTSQRSWERQANETDKSYAAFRVYMELPVYGADEERRSLANVAKKLGLASTSGVEDWSAKYNWVDRVAAYDNYISTSVLTVREAALKDFQQTVITRMGIQLAVLNDIMDKELGKVKQKQLENVDLDPVDLKRLAETLRIKDDLARRIAGMPTTYKVEQADEENADEATYIIGG